MGVPVVPDWLFQEFLQADAAPNDTPDAANPYWNFDFEPDSEDDYTPTPDYPSSDLSVNPALTLDC
jgi:hypothetical protein